MKKRKKTKKSSKKSLRLSTLGLFLLFIVGLCIALYPYIANKVAEHNAIVAISSYDNIVVNLTPAEIKKLWKGAKKYNENLMGDPVHDPFVPGSGMALPENYEDVLNTDEDGTMGYVKIPCINVSLPIRHGTSDYVLSNGVGHIQQTALPIGGKGTHSVLTSHTGLPSAQLFSDLDQMVIGDKFYIYVLDKKLSYQVDKIDIILPEDIDQLIAIPNEDHVTLVTCTPYGINDHRLLVRGKRIPNEKEEEVVTETKDTYRWWWWTIMVVLIVCNLILLIIVLRKWYEEHKKKVQRRRQEHGEEGIESSEEGSKEEE